MCRTPKVKLTVEIRTSSTKREALCDICSRKAVAKVGWEVSGVTPQVRATWYYAVGAGLHVLILVLLKPPYTYVLL